MKEVALQAGQFAEWLADTDIGLFELHTPHGSLRLGREGGEIVELPLLDAADAVAPTVVRAPSVGVFLRSHPLADAPLARIGEQVPAGQTVGLLQIGPLLLPVTTAEAGEIAAMCVAHGLPVGYGMPLVELHPL
ncbi:acetyl-CoA carboxylase biotin carboxyl carrier protein subunit [Variovorax sp. E3]|uniref:acetyl-CoA carboxylase biotin carboxyl carrier protein n=1 Tax=Variovorax sp. E3 TaxID=1914993 RepID=UPI0018DBCE30|nr:acetyl-CoA carboxylase biotin carboxyl carrier protein subunit [Variovorax sp. E3]